MKVTSRLFDKIASGRTVLTAGCLPQPDGDGTATKRLAAFFPATLDSVVVADNPGQVRGSALACAALLAAAGLEPMLSLLTRDRNRIALEADVLGASALGVGGFLCLNGVHQALGASPPAKGTFDLDATQLCQALAIMKTDGRGFDGSRLSFVPAFAVAAAAHPYLRPLELAVLQAKKKILAGAQVLLTDPVFDLPAFEEWMAAMRAAGLDKKAAIVASVLPLTSVAQAELLKARSGFAPIGDEIMARLRGSRDVVQTGITIVAEVATRLKTTAGVRGIHLQSEGCEAMVPRLVQEAGLAERG